MIYMVEMDFRHPEREAEWHAWYLAHIAVLLTVPGFRASQRFRAVGAAPSPFLALHEVESAALFESPAYRIRGGPASTGEWRGLQSNWHRNLLAGLEATPDVPAEACLLMLRDAREVDPPPGIRVDWLEGVGLDRTIGWCGLAVLSDLAPVGDLVAGDSRIRLFRPISEKLRAAA